MTFESIREYWDQRAKSSAGERNATTDDIHLRDLEVSTITSTLSAAKVSTVVDVGCGDGDTTLRIATALPDVTIHGIDYSPNMIEIAKRRLAASGLTDRVSFAVGDATQLAEICGIRQFDAAVTCRALINLPTMEMQLDVLRQIASILQPGGLYVGSENFTDGQRNLNDARARMGLPEIPVRWHNLYFDREALLTELRRPFDQARIEDFASSYYFATRVLYSALCQVQGTSPDYDHEIHRLAPKLPATGRFSPVQLIVARRGASE